MQKRYGLLRYALNTGWRDTGEGITAEDLSYDRRPTVAIGYKAKVSVIGLKRS